MSGQKLSSFRGSDVPSGDILANCIHCGLCLPHCPTYALTGLEKSSPRGRIRLIKSVADGEFNMTRGFIDEMYFCLDCQACESACPAGVRFGALVEAARAQIEQQGGITLREKFLKSLIFRWMMVSSKRLKLLACRSCVRKFYCYAFELAMGVLCQHTFWNCFDHPYHIVLSSGEKSVLGLG